MAEEELESAPGPGRYDRGLSSEQRTKDQKERLLIAAAEVFAEHGYAGASVERIIKRVRMSRRTFYVHFRDLSHALTDVFESGANQLFAHVDRAVRAEKTPVDRLIAGIRAYLEAMGASAPLARALYNEIRSAGPEHAARLESMRVRYVELWKSTFSETLRGRKIPGISDDTTLYAIASALDAVALRYLDHDEEHRILEALEPLARMTAAVMRIKDAEVERGLARAMSSLKLSAATSDAKG